MLLRHRSDRKRAGAGWCQPESQRQQPAARRQIPRGTWGGPPSQSQQPHCCPCPLCLRHSLGQMREVHQRSWWGELLGELVVVTSQVLQLPDTSAFPSDKLKRLQRLEPLPPAHMANMWSCGIPEFWRIPSRTQGQQCLAVDTRGVSTACQTAQKLQEIFCGFPERFEFSQPAWQPSDRTLEKTATFLQPWVSFRGGAGRSAWDPSKAWRGPWPPGKQILSPASLQSSSRNTSRRDPPPPFTDSRAERSRSTSSGS